MQKILGTLILCLLWCNASFTSEIKPFNKSGFIFNDGERIKYGTYGIVDKVVVSKTSDNLRNCKIHHSDKS